MVALIVTGECRAETVADNSSETMEYHDSPLNIFPAINANVTKDWYIETARITIVSSVFDFNYK